MKSDLKYILIGWYFSPFHHKIQTAKLALRRLKTLRHPNILRYIDGLEVFVVDHFFSGQILVFLCFCVHYHILAYTETKEN